MKFLKFEDYLDGSCHFPIEKVCASGVNRKEATLVAQGVWWPTHDVVYVNAKRVLKEEIIKQILKNEA